MAERATAGSVRAARRTVQTSDTARSRAPNTWTSEGVGPNTATVGMPARAPRAPARYRRRPRASRATARRAPPPRSCRWCRCTVPPPRSPRERPLPGPSEQHRPQATGRQAPHQISHMRLRQIFVAHSEPRQTAASLSPAAEASASRAAASHAGWTTSCIRPRPAPRPLARSARAAGRRSLASPRAPCRGATRESGESDALGMRASRASTAVRTDRCEAPPARTAGSRASGRPAQPGEPAVGASLVEDVHVPDAGIRQATSRREGRRRRRSRIGKRRWSAPTSAK